MTECEKKRHLLRAAEMIGDVLEGQHAARNRVLIAVRELGLWLEGDADGTPVDDRTPFDELARIDPEEEASRAG